MLVIAPKSVKVKCDRCERNRRIDLPSTLELGCCSCDRTISVPVNFVSLGDGPEFELNLEEFNKLGWYEREDYIICPLCFIPEDWD